MLTKEELEKLIEESPVNERGRHVIPDDVFMENLKQLPDKIESETGKLSCSNGYVNLLQKGTKRASEVASMGGTRSQEMYRKRKTWAESIDIYLKQTDKNGKSNQDKIIEAMAAKAMKGCVGAGEFLRDTVGEKPSENVNLDVMSDGDRELIQKMFERINDGTGSTKK